MAEIRKQALLASGAQIEGLQAGTAAPAAKKVVYGNRKKKGPIAKEVSPAPSRPRSPEPELAVTTPPPAEEPIAAETGAPDSWDASTDDETAKPAAPEGVKDSWDDPSDDETKKVPVAAPAPAPEKATPAPTLTPNKSQATGELEVLLIRKERD